MLDSLSPTAQRFLRESLASPLQLETLILLHSQPQRWWTAATVSEQTRASTAAAAAALEALGRANLVDVRVGASLRYRFAPLDARLVTVVDEIAVARRDGRR